MAEKREAFWQRHRRAAALLGVLLAAALVAAWAGYDLGRRVDNRPVYAIVNDTYSRTVPIPAGEPGLTQSLPLEAGQRLYGVRLDFATFDHAFAGGELHAELYSAAGEVLATGTLPLLGLKDNTFAALLFDAPCTAAAAQTLSLRLWYTPPAGDAAPLGLWASEGAVSAMPLADGSGALNATAAVQYITDYSGRWSARLSLALGLLTGGAAVLGFGLLFVKKKPAPLAAVFAAEALLLGTAFALVTPPLVAPDEYTHLAAGYRQSSTLLGQQTAAGKDGTLYLTVRPCDAPYFSDKTGQIGIFAYKRMLEHLGDSGADPACTAVTDIPADAGGGYRLYVGQVAGISLARMLGLGFFGMLLLGRLGNLLVYTAFAALGVALAPRRLRGLFACVGLLPMATQLAGSLSGDGIVLGLLFAYTALCMALRERPATRRDAVLLVAGALLIGPLKAIYLPAVLLVLLVPNDHLALRAAPAALPGPGAKRRCPPGVLLKAAALLAAAAFWLRTNLTALLYATRDVDNVGLTRAAAVLAAAAVALALIYRRAARTDRGKKAFRAMLLAAVLTALPVGLYKLTHMWGGLKPEDLVDSIQPNGDSVYVYSVGYICRNLPGTAKLLLRSASSQGALWLQGVLGTALGEPIVYPVMVSWVLGVGLVLMLLAAALPAAGEPPRLGRRARLGAGLVLALVVGLSVLAALTWTPINYTVIFGVQGRYWLPVLPLALLLAGEQLPFRATKPTACAALFAAVCLNGLVLLQGYGIYAAFGL